MNRTMDRGSLEILQEPSEIARFETTIAVLDQIQVYIQSTVCHKDFLQSSLQMDSTLPPLLQVFQLIDKLKHTPRTGWVRSGIPQPETIASHMYRMAMMAMTCPECVVIPRWSSAEQRVDRHKCIQMALVHDLGEAIVGDITPHCGISTEEKHARELDAMKSICKLLEGTHAQQEVHQLWIEYEQKETAESLLVHDLDKFDMVLQAFDYERKTGIQLDSFFQGTLNGFHTELVRSWDQSVRNQRNPINPK